jgi:hypothetical protein
MNMIKKEGIVYYNRFKMLLGIIITITTVTTIYLLYYHILGSYFYTTIGITPEGFVFISVHI